MDKNLTSAVVKDLSHTQAQQRRELENLMKDAVLVRRNEEVAKTGAHVTVTQVIFSHGWKVRRAYDLCKSLYPRATITPTYDVKELKEAGAATLEDVLRSPICEFEFSDKKSAAQFHEKFKDLVKQEFYIDSTKDETVPAPFNRLSPAEIDAWANTPEAERLMPNYTQNRKIMEAALQAAALPIQTRMMQ